MRQRSTQLCATLGDMLNTHRERSKAMRALDVLAPRALEYCRHRVAPTGVSHSGANPQGAVDDTVTPPKQEMITAVLARGTHWVS